MSDSLDELMAEVVRENPTPIFLGAVAVSEPETLCTNPHRFLYVILELKKEKVPERFREAVKAVEIDMGQYIPMSSSIEQMFFDICDVHHPKVWWRTDESDRDWYKIPAKKAKELIKKEAFTYEELEWLWGIAQRLHIFPWRPVQKRELVFEPA